MVLQLKNCCKRAQHAFYKHDSPEKIPQSHTTATRRQQVAHRGPKLSSIVHI